MAVSVLAMPLACFCLGHAVSLFLSWPWVRHSRMCVCRSGRHARTHTHMHAHIHTRTHTIHDRTYMFVYSMMSVCQGDCVLCCSFSGPVPDLRVTVLCVVLCSDCVVCVVLCCSFSGLVPDLRVTVCCVVLCSDCVVL